MRIIIKDEIGLDFAINTISAEKIVCKILSNFNKEPVIIDFKWLHTVIFEFIRIIIKNLNEAKTNYKIVNKWIFIKNKINMVIEEQEKFNK